MAFKHVEIRGINRLAATIDRKMVTLPARIGSAMHTIAEEVATESKKLTPVDTGALRASTHTKPPVFTARNIEVSIMVGGPSAPYAVKVHEDLHAGHKVGQAKYLETAITQRRQTLIRDVADIVSKQS